MPRKPVLNFSHQFSHNIWKVHAFKESRFIVLEIRDQESLQVSFSVLDTANTKLSSTDITFEESWWITVSEINGDEALFYTFDADNNPQPQKFINYNLETNSIIWEKEAEEDAQNLFKESNNVASIDVPFHYQAGSDYFKTVEDFLASFLNKSAVKAVNYLEKKHLVFCSYFVNKGDSLEGFLLSIDRNREVFLHESLGNFDEGITDNTFFIFNNNLIFVKGITDFFMYDLNL